MFRHTLLNSTIDSDTGCTYFLVEFKVAVYQLTTLIDLPLTFDFSAPLFPIEYSQSLNNIWHLSEKTKVKKVITADVLDSIYSGIIELMDRGELIDFPNYIFRCLQLA